MAPESTCIARPVGLRQTVALNWSILGLIFCEIRREALRDGYGPFLTARADGSGEGSQTRSDERAQIWRS